MGSLMGSVSLNHTLIYPFIIYAIVPKFVDCCHHSPQQLLNLALIKEGWVGGVGSFINFSQCSFLKFLFFLSLTKSLVALDSLVAV